MVSVRRVLSLAFSALLVAECLPGPAAAQPSVRPRGTGICVAQRNGRWVNEPCIDAPERPAGRERTPVDSGPSTAAPSPAPRRREKTPAEIAIAQAQARDRAALGQTIARLSAPRAVSAPTRPAPRPPRGRDPFGLGNSAIAAPLKVPLGPGTPPSGVAAEDLARARAILEVASRAAGAEDGRFLAEQAALALEGAPLRVWVGPSAPRPTARQREAEILLGKVAALRREIALGEAEKQRLRTELETLGNRWATLSGAQDEAGLKSLSTVTEQLDAAREAYARLFEDEATRRETLQQAEAQLETVIIMVER